MSALQLKVLEGEAPDESTDSDDVVPTWDSPLDYGHDDDDDDDDEERARRYSDDQPRDADGRFGEGDGDGKPALTPEEHDAVFRYTGSPAPVINKFLRDGGEPRPNTVAAYLDSAMSKSAPLTEPTTVWRTLYMGSPEDAKAFVKDHTDGVLTDKGFISTAREKDAAFPVDPESGSVQIEIDLPAGVKGIDVPAVLKDVDDQLKKDNPGGHSNIEIEHELILPRGSSFTIDKAKWSPLTGGHMHMTYKAAA